MKASFTSHPKGLFTWPTISNARQLPYVNWHSKKSDPLLLFHPNLNFYPLPERDRLRNMIVRKHSSSLFEEDREIQMQRPYLPQGYFETPMVHEIILARAPFFNVVTSILDRIESTFDSNSKGFMWNDTGYWIASNGVDRYYGVGYVSALNLWSTQSPDELCYVTSSPSQLLCFTLERTVPDQFYIDAYFFNQFFAFPDLIYSLHNAAKQTMKWDAISISKVDYERYTKHNIAFSYFSHVLRGKKFRIRPICTISDRQNHRGPSKSYDCVIFNGNPKDDGFTRRAAENCIVATFRGGFWYDSSFGSDNRYYVWNIEQRVLRTCVLADVVVEKVFPQGESQEFR